MGRPTQPAVSIVLASASLLAAWATWTRCSCCHMALEREQVLAGHAVAHRLGLRAAGAVQLLDRVERQPLQREGLAEG
jgi:hypothetical protein